MQRLILLALMLLGLSVCEAAEPRAADQIRISSPTTDDLYLAGEEVNILAPVTGDIVAAAGKIHLNDSLWGDALLAGGELFVNAYVLDDIRAFGGTIHISADVGGDVLIFGGTVKIDQNSEVEGDVIVFGGELEVLGNIKGSLRSFGGSINFSGSVQEDAVFKAGDVYLNGSVAGKTSIAAEDIDLGESASFTGRVRYWTPDGQADFAGAATDAVYDEDLGEGYEDSEWTGIGFFGFLFYSLFASLLLAILLVFGFGQYFAQGSQYLKDDFAKSFGLGVLYVILLPVLVFLLMLTLIGIPLGILTLVLYGFSLIFAPAITAVLITYYLNKRYSKNWNRWFTVLISGGVFLLLSLLMMIPFVGWLIGIVVIGAAFGALVLATFKARSKLEQQRMTT